jgi:hypothetical protein
MTFLSDRGRFDTVTGKPQVFLTSLLPVSRQNSKTAGDNSESNAMIAAGSDDLENYMPFTPLRMPLIMTSKLGAICPNVLRPKNSAGR